MSKLSGTIEGGWPGHTAADGNSQPGRRYQINLAGFVEQHLCTSDHCRDVSGAPTAW